MLGKQAIGAGCWEPVKVVSREFPKVKAVGNACLPVGVIGAATGLEIEELTGNTRVVNITRVFVFEFIKAALAAAIAERLPLGVGHGGKRS